MGPSTVRGRRVKLPGLLGGGVGSERRAGGGREGKRREGSSEAGVLGRRSALLAAVPGPRVGQAVGLSAASQEAVRAVGERAPPARGVDGGQIWGRG